MTAKVLGPLNLVDVNPAVPIINPLAAQIDVALFGSLGLGSLQSDLSARLSAVLQANANIGLHISNPYVGFQMALAGIAQLQAQISAALSGAIPVVSVEATSQLAANAAIITDLELRLAGLNAIIDAMAEAKLPATNFAAKLAVGPVWVYAWESKTDGFSKTQALDGIKGVMASLPEKTYGVLLVTGAEDVWVGIKGMLNTEL